MISLREATGMVLVFIGGTFIVGALAPSGGATVFASLGWTAMCFGVVLVRYKPREG